MVKADTGLERVQNLYVMQVELCQVLRTANLRDPSTRKQVRSQVKQFEQLLGRADHRYMGGEDVLQSLRELPAEILKRLRESPSSVKRVTGTRRRKR